MLEQIKMQVEATQVEPWGSLGGSEVAKRDSSSIAVHRIPHLASWENRSQKLQETLATMNWGVFPAVFFSRTSWNLWIYQDWPRPLWQLGEWAAQNWLWNGRINNKGCILWILWTMISGRTGMSFLHTPATLGDLLTEIPWSFFGYENGQLLWLANPMMVFSC